MVGVRIRHDEDVRQGEHLRHDEHLRHQWHLRHRRHPVNDTNARVSTLLRDLAAVQKSQQSRWGYRRAAAAVLALEEPLESLLQPDGTLRKIPHVGPSSTRVILEVLQSGHSPTVEHAIEESARSGDVAHSRGLRGSFLSPAQVVDALRNKALNGPRLEHYRGDLQMHSSYSDGRTTLDLLAEGCLARGYRYCAVTDHAYGLPIANGMSMSDLARQHAEIDALNRHYKGRFRMLKGIEANILADGSLDLKPADLKQLEVVVAAPHSKLRTTEDQTSRMIAVVTTRGVHILGHPRGRKAGVREGVKAKWDKVFATAACSGVAIEIDGDPSRQDVDFALAQRALRAGCLFALDSDAHSVGELSYAEIAIAHARLAGIPRSRVVNCWGLKKLITWLRAAWDR